MALILKDRVQETTTSTGTGAVTLAGAITGYQDFSSAIGNGNTCYYTIVLSSEWEVGIGTYSSTGNTLSRDTVLESSNAGSLVNFSAGTKNVFVTYPAEKGVYLDATGNAIGLGTPASFVGTNITGTASGLTAGSVTNGVYTTGTQSIAGAKTFSDITTVSNTTASTAYTNGALIVGGGLGVAGQISVNSNLNRVTSAGNASWLQQDGTGRSHWYWNSYGGTSPTYTNAGEDASSISLHITGSGAGGTFFHRSASGVGKAAGDPITWTTTIYSDLNTFSWKGNTVLRSDNYNTYSPTLTGTGASGTWGISITGNAANITGTYAGTITSSQVTTALGYTPPSNATTLTINGTAYDLTANRSWSVGTVTSVAALTLGTTGTDLSSTVATGTTTPVITLNVPTASATNRGALSSTDWSTFNNKQAALVSGTNIKTVNGTTLLGSGDLGTIGIAYGGTNSTATPTAGGVAYGTGTAYAITSAGTSGQVLTSAGAGAPTWSTVSVAGGATETTTSADITLTSSSNRLQKAVQSGTNKSFILPNATTISQAGANIFQLVNAGSSTAPMYIQNNSGGLIYRLNAGDSGSVGLSNITNANTGWTVNDSDCYYQRTLPSTIVSGTISYIQTATSKTISIDSLTSTTFLISYALYNGTSGFYDLYVVVATRSGNTFSYGTPLLIYTGVSGAQAQRSIVTALSSTTALIAWATNATAPVMSVNGLTISGTTITKTASALSVGNGSLHRMVKLTSTQAILCLQDGSGAASGTHNIRVVTHNGTSTPTAGTAVSYLSWTTTINGTGDRKHDVAIQSTTKGYIFHYNGTNMYAGAFTVSGTTITLGTVLITPIYGSNSTHEPTIYGSFPVSATDAACLTSDGLIWYTVSGTTMTVGGYSGANTINAGQELPLNEYNPSDIYYPSSTTTLVGVKGKTYQYVSGNGVKLLSSMTNLQSFKNDTFEYAMCLVSGSTNKFAVVGFPEISYAPTFTSTATQRFNNPQIYILEPVA